MKKLFIIFIAILFGSSNFVMAETSAVKCFEMGFIAASKAYNAGDKSAFTPIYGMSPKMMKASPCCNIGTDQVVSVTMGLFNMYSNTEPIKIL